MSSRPQGISPTECAAGLRTAGRAHGVCAECTRSVLRRSLREGEEGRRGDLVHRPLAHRDGRARRRPVHRALSGREMQCRARDRAGAVPAPQPGHEGEGRELRRVLLHRPRPVRDAAAAKAAAAVQAETAGRMRAAGARFRSDQPDHHHRREHDGDVLQHQPRQGRRGAEEVDRPARSEMDQPGRGRASGFQRRHGRLGRRR